MKIKFPQKEKKTVKGWAMFLDAYYPVFVGAFEGVGGERGTPPVNHTLADMFEKSGQKVLWEPCKIIYEIPARKGIRSDKKEPSSN